MNNRIILIVGVLFTGIFAYTLFGLDLVKRDQEVASAPVIEADVVVYKSPTCGCCAEWAKHLKEND